MKSFVSILSGFVNSDLFDVGSIAFDTLSVHCGIFDHMLLQMENSKTRIMVLLHHVLSDNVYIWSLISFVRAKGI